VRDEWNESVKVVERDKGKKKQREFSEVNQVHAV